MTDPAAALRAILDATMLLDTPVGVFVGHVPAKKPKPYVVIQGLSDPGHHTLAGPAAIGNPLLGLECYGRTSPEATALATAVEGFLNGFRGRLGRLFVQGVLKRDRRGPTAQLPEDGSDQPTAFREDVDFEVWRTA